MMNKNFLWIAALCLVSACKTSGDLRAEKMKDPSEVRTISQPQSAATSPTPVSQVQPTQLQSEDLARQIEILKGQIQERDYLYGQEKAQLDARIQGLEAERARLIEEIQILKGTAPVAGQGGDLLWETAQKDLKKKRYSEAASTLKDFMENFPKDPRAEEAFILKGQSEYAAGQFKTSLVTFGTYLDKYPKGKRRAMAWLGQGANLIRMKQKKDSKLFFEQCVSLHPKTKEARLARKLLRTPNYVPPEIFL
ncbi:MAG: outer membrane protein assembly factor BamD [Bdellovibrionota bacterium]